MAQASIPVDPFNPGQVFACVGFLEAADILSGDAEGGFDWTDFANVRFVLNTSGGANPFEVVLEFLATAKIRYCTPPAAHTLSSNSESDSGPDPDAEEDDVDVDALTNFVESETFPCRTPDRMSLPIRLESTDHAIELGHWTDGSRRNDFKLYSGNRSAYKIACAMVSGTRKNPTKKQTVGDPKTLGIAALWDQKRTELIEAPFDVVTLMGGSFNFDPRGAWTARDAGYSPNQQRHGIAASPVVEMLTAWGLEHARPSEFATRQVRYSVWSGRFGPMLARAIFGGTKIPVQSRKFTFELALSGKNKVITFAQEELNQ